MGSRELFEAVVGASCIGGIVLFLMSVDWEKILFDKYKCNTVYLSCNIH